jgi:hypothetical protein
MCKDALKGLVLGVLAAVIVALGIGPALARGGDQNRPPANQALVSPAGPQAFGGSAPLVIPAAAFTSDGWDPDGFFFSFSGGYVNGDGSACLKAPVYLPKGAVVYRTYASLYDNDSSGSITVNLRRVNKSTGATNVMASMSTTSDSTSIQNRPDLSISYPEIEYPLYAYYATTCLKSADHRLYSVRIYYHEYWVYLPLVLRE